MADYSNAVQTLKRLAVQYQGIVDAVELVEKLGSIEQATAEAARARDAARAELATALRDRDAAFVALEGARKEAEDVKAAAAAEVVSARAKAESDAALVLANARARVDEIIGEANARANAAHEAQTLRADLLEQEIGAMEQSAIAAREASAKANADADTAAKKLSDIQAAIAKLAGAVVN